MLYLIGPAIVLGIAATFYLYANWHHTKDEREIRKRRRRAKSIMNK